ncbi:hypothetical protein ACFL4G_12790 [Thermodesulfobacteriota bacterium]
MHSNAHRTIQLLACLFVVISLDLPGCAGREPIPETADAIGCRFELAGVDSMRVSGIDLSGITRYRDLPLYENSSLRRGYDDRELPAQFTISLKIVNPKGNGSTVRISSLEWTLLIRGIRASHGIITDCLEIPPTGEPVLVRIPVNFDLARHFDGSELAEIVELASDIGSNRKPSDSISLRIRPTLQTSMGPKRNKEAIHISG